MTTYAYKPTFSPYISCIKAKNRNDAINRLIDMWPEYPQKIVKSWLYLIK